MNFASNAVLTKAPNFMDLGLPAFNISDEFNTFGNPATGVTIPTDRPHWSAPDHVSVKATVVGMIVTRSELDYSYKTDFQNGKKNQEFGSQNISMSLPPLESTPIVMKMSNRTISPIDLIPIKTEIS